MATALDVAAGVLAADPLCEDGTFLPTGGDPVPCRLRFTRPDPEGQLGDSGYRNQGVRIMLFTEGLPAFPTTADRVIARGDTYDIRDVQREPHGFWVTLDVDPV